MACLVVIFCMNCENLVIILKYIDCQYHRKFRVSYFLSTKKKHGLKIKIITFVRRIFFFFFVFKKKESALIIKGFVIMFCFYKEKSW